MFLKLDHLAEETIQNIEHILHTNERPSRGRFHEGRGTNYREKMIEMHISEIGFCSGHSASGVWVNETRARRRCRASMRPATWRSVPHSYMLGAFVYGRFARRERGAVLRGHRAALRSTRSRSHASTRG